MSEPYIAIVGVCAAGKTTLAQGLTQAGLKAVSVPQEHSSVRRLWEKLHPQANIVIMLDAQYETTRQRRPSIGYGPERLEDQRERLRFARERADLYLPTDDLNVEQVRQTVLRWLEERKERNL